MVVALPLSLVLLGVVAITMISIPIQAAGYERKAVSQERLTLQRDIGSFIRENGEDIKNNQPSFF
ncbi:MAG: hypothetical protein M3270_07935 [Thermoproteota archaeon]|nr:hypothetical protein [Thermoproteota archaeon]